MLQFDTQALLPWNETGFAYVSVGTEGVLTATIASASRYALGTKEAARSNGVYLNTDEVVTFALDEPALLAEGITPKPRDTVEPPGECPRVVLDVQPNRFLKFWRLTVRDLVVAYDLRDLLTVKRSTPTPQADGSRLRNPSNAAVDVPGRLQPEEWQRELDTDQRVTTRRRYTAYLGQALVLEAGDTIVLDDTEYEVTGQSDISQLDSLTRVSCERIE